MICCLFIPVHTVPCARHTNVTEAESLGVATESAAAFLVVPNFTLFNVRFLVIWSKDDWTDERSLKQTSIEEQ